MRISDWSSDVCSSDLVLASAHSTGALISATLATSFGTNIVAADQYIAIVVPGRIYRSEYAKRGLAPVNLSRALEDAGTITSPLIPWNTCGAYMAAALAVATFDYPPYPLFNLGIERRPCGKNVCQTV